MQLKPLLKQGAISSSMPLFFQWQLRNILAVDLSDSELPLWLGNKGRFNAERPVDSFVIGVMD